MKRMSCYMDQQMLVVVVGVQDQSQEEEEPWMRHLDEVTPTYWLVGVSENGDMELYSVQDFSLTSVALNFSHQADVLVDNMSTRDSIHAELAINLNKLSPLAEILMVGMGMQGRRPNLLARDRELVMYEVYTYHSRSFAQELHQCLILRERRSKTKSSPLHPTPPPPPK